MKKLDFKSIFEKLNSPYYIQVNEFNSVYKFLGADYSNDQTEEESNQEQFCKYCKRKFPDVSFSNIAHTIPEFLGNQYSVTRFECDSCNRLFGRYENQLYKFFGHLITINGTKGKRGIPNSISGDNQTIAEKRKFHKNTEGIFYGSDDSNSQNIKYNEIDGVFEITSTTEKFNPLSVYKALTKLAIGLLPIEKLNRYNEVLIFLLDKKHRLYKSNEIFNLICFSLKKRYERTSIFLFEQKTNLEIPELCFVLIYENFMFQIFIPTTFNNHYSNLQICPLFPPALNIGGVVYLDFIANNIDLNTTEPKARRIKQIFKVNIPNDQIYVMDMDTYEKKEIEFNPHNIKQFILVKAGTNIPIKSN